MTYFFRMVHKGMERGATGRVLACFSAICAEPAWRWRAFAPVAAGVLSIHGQRFMMSGKNSEVI